MIPMHINFFHHSLKSSMMSIIVELMGDVIVIMVVGQSRYDITTEHILDIPVSFYYTLLLMIQLLLLLLLLLLLVSYCGCSYRVIRTRARGKSIQSISEHP